MVNGIVKEFFNNFTVRRIKYYQQSMKKLLFIIPVLIILIGSCADNRFDADISGINAEPEVKFFHADFDSIKAEHIYNSLDRLHNSYGEFTDFYLQQILGSGDYESAGFITRCSDFTDYCIVNDVFKDVNTQFPDVESVKKYFVSGFKHYKYYFPEDTLPVIYTIISGFQESVFPSDGLCAVSLEKYLGADYKAYSQLGIDYYKRRRMTPENMAVDYFKAVYSMKFLNADAENNMISEMIERGKMQYFLNAVLPDVPDSLRWGCDNMRCLWQQKYEEDIWNYLVEKKMLFSTNTVEIRNFTGEGPFTNAFGQESAPGAASYCGFEIVKSFMDRNPEITLPALMKITDMKLIYNKAAYKP